MAIGLPSEGVAQTSRPANDNQKAGNKLATASLAAGEAVIGRLEAREWLRRFWHMAPGLVGAVLFLIPHRDPVSSKLWWIVLGIGGAIGLNILAGFRRIERTNEASGKSAVAGYLFSVLGMVLLFPSHLELAVTVLAILAFGDGSATLVGLLVRGPKLPWNRTKSWSGLAAFIGIGTLTASLYYHAETLNPEAINPSVSWPFAVLIVAPAVIFAGLAESIQSRINDNIRVGVVASLLIAGIHFLLVA